MRQIEKPELISTIIDKKKVWYNIRESRLSYMLHRKLISVNKYEAGSRYRRHWEFPGALRTLECGLRDAPIMLP